MRGGHLGGLGDSGRVGGGGAEPLTAGAGGVPATRGMLDNGVVARGHEQLGATVHENHADLVAPLPLEEVLAGGFVQLQW